jgi:hypothetical protein
VWFPSCHSQGQLDSNAQHITFHPHHSTSTKKKGDARAGGGGRGVPRVLWKVSWLIPPPFSFLGYVVILFGVGVGVENTTASLLLSRRSLKNANLVLGDNEGDG